MKKVLLLSVLLMCAGSAYAQCSPTSATCQGQYVNALPGHGGYQPYYQQTYAQPVYQQPVYQQPSYQPRYYGQNGGFVNPNARQVGQYRRY